MSSLSVFTLILFSLLRPNNTIVYAPKYKYSLDEKRPPKPQAGFFSWIGPILTMKEDTMIDKLGLDAVTFLRYLRMLRWMFVFITAHSHRHAH